MLYNLGFRPQKSTKIATQKTDHSIAIHSIFCVRMAYIACYLANPHVQTVQSMCGTYQFRWLKTRFFRIFPCPSIKKVMHLKAIFGSMKGGKSLLLTVHELDFWPILTYRLEESNPATLEWSKRPLHWWKFGEENENIFFWAYLLCITLQELQHSKYIYAVFRILWHFEDWKFLVLILWLDNLKSALVLVFTVSGTSS